MADTGTATVAYSYYTNNTCTTGQVAVNTVTVPTSGVVPNSNGHLQQRRHLLLAGGLQRRRQQQRASSPCTAANNEQLTVNKASPTISHDASSSSIAAGTAANDTLDPDRGWRLDAGRPVAYSYYTNNTCTTTPVDGGHGDGADERHVPNSSSGHLQQRRHLLLAGGLQRRRQQQRRLEPVHGAEQRAADGDQGVADDHDDPLGGLDHAPAAPPTTPRR